MQNELEQLVRVTGILWGRSTQNLFAGAKISPFLSACGLCRTVIKYSMNDLVATQYRWLVAF